MDSRPPCVINWGAGFNCCLLSHSKWWNAEPCVRNASIFTTLCGLPAWLTQTLRLCYLKSTLENGVGNQILLQETAPAFPWNLRKETIIFPQIFSIFDIPLRDERNSQSKWDKPRFPREALQAMYYVYGVDVLCPLSMAILWRHLGKTRKFLGSLTVSTNRLFCPLTEIMFMSKIN